MVEALKAGPGRDDEGTRRRTLLAGAAAVLAAGGLAALLPPVQKAAYELAVAVFGPPAVEARERFAAEPVTRSFDHGAYDAVLSRVVDPDGWVDYAALAADPSGLDTYLGSLATTALDGLGRAGRLALLINAYNAFTLRLMVDHWPLGSIREIPAQDRWAARRWRLGGELVSLDEIEHERIRRDFAEPRVHFALVCASVGCPPLRGEAYVPDRLEAQLEDNTRRVHREPSRWIAHDPGAHRLALTPLYLWYAGDFAAAGGAVAFVARYHAGVAAGRTEGPPALRWLPYDWSVNGIPQDR